MTTIHNKFTNVVSRRMELLAVLGGCVVFVVRTKVKMKTWQGIMRT